MTAEPRCTVLISSCGRRVALVDLFRSALRELGLAGAVLGCDITTYSAAFHAVDRGFLVPRCTDPAFVPAVIELCRREGVRLIVPTIDTELPAYAAHRDLFEANGIRVSVSTPEVVDIGRWKDRTNQWLRTHGFPTVRQWRLHTAALPSDLAFPLMVKPRGGSASIGVRRVDCLEAIGPVCAEDDLLAETIAPGREYTVDVFVDRGGRCLCAVPRLRIEVRAGEVSKGRTVRSPPIETLAAKIAESLPGAYGVLNIQLFWDEPSQQATVVEINPRFGGGFPLAAAAGADYPRWLVEDAVGRPISASSANWRDGLVMLRYDAAVFLDDAQLPQ